MSCRKKCGKCNECEPFKSDQGPRGFRGERGPTGVPGNVGPTGPCCTGPTGPASEAFPFSSPIPVLKALGATFYGVGPGLVPPFGIFDFPLDGPNDPIGRVDSGTFVLPFAGLYKVSWQMPIFEGAEIGFGPVHVQSTLTAQTVAEGAFVPVAGGVSGRGAPMAELVGETIVEATRNNFPIRIENTSRGTTGPTGAPGPGAAVNYYSPDPQSGNQRTINIASIVPQRLDAYGFLINDVFEIVAPNSDVTFNKGSGFSPGDTGPNGGIDGTGTSNMGVTPPSPPYVGLVIQQTRRYSVSWNVKTPQANPGDANIGDLRFVPYVNGAPIANATIIRGDGLLVANFTVGDVITVRNTSGDLIPLADPAQVGPNAVLIVNSSTGF